MILVFDRGLAQVFAVAPMIVIRPIFNPWELRKNKSVFFFT